MTESQVTHPRSEDQSTIRFRQRRSLAQRPTAIREIEFREKSEPISHTQKSRIKSVTSLVAGLFNSIFNHQRERDLNYWLHIEYGEHATREAERMNPRMIR